MLGLFGDPMDEGGEVVASDEEEVLVGRDVEGSETVVLVLIPPCCALTLVIPPN